MRGCTNTLRRYELSAPFAIAHARAHASNAYTVYIYMQSQERWVTVKRHAN